MDDPAFVAYLELLARRERPEYARSIHYPHALFFLDQLQRKEFRRAMANPRAVEHVFSQQFYHWQKFRTEQLAEGKPRTAPRSETKGGEGGAAQTAGRSR